MISDDLITCPVRGCAWRTEVSSEDQDASLSYAVNHVREHGYSTEEALAAIHELDERPAPTDETREAWLHRVVLALTEWFEEVGEQVPPIRISIGWPSRGGLGKTKKVVGECWKSSASEDGINQIFISPIHGADQSGDAIETVLHEMIHAIDDCEHGHKNDFVRIAKSVGFIAPWTSTPPSDELRERIQGLIETLGPIPSAALGKVDGAADTPDKQKNRQVKAECANGTGYKVRLTRKWISEFGAPDCACCHAPMKVEEPKPDGA